MTRINLVPPRELYDQHLFAEWREIKMVPMSLARSLRARGLDGVVKMIPAQFTLGKGHVSFFYNKGRYLHERYWQLTTELVKRGFKLAPDMVLDPLCIFDQNLSLMNNYVPTPEALILIRERIASRVALKPQWYRYTVPNG